MRRPLAFLGCLRGGSLLPDGCAFDPSRHLRQRDVDTRPADHVTLTIRLEKTNNDARVSRAVTLYATGRADCPRAAALGQLRQNPKGEPDAPFFQTTLGLPMTRRSVETRLQHAAGSLGRNPTSYTLHSPRIGMVNALLLQGYPFAFIKRYGQWTSDAVFEYVRVQLPDGHVATRDKTASTKMAQKRARRHVDPARLHPFLELEQ